MCVYSSCVNSYECTLCVWGWSYVVALSSHINNKKQQQQHNITTTTKSARNQNKIELSGKAYCEFAFVRFRNE